MSEITFSVVSVLATVAWLGLAVSASLRAGRARAILLFISGRIAPILLCAVYVIVLVMHWGSTPGGSFRSLHAVQLLFSAPGKMLGLWTHALAFDLLVGRWLVDHASAGGNSRAPLLIALPATFLFGPLGVLAYFLCQFGLRARFGEAAVET